MATKKAKHHNAYNAKLKPIQNPNSSVDKFVHTAKANTTTAGADKVEVKENENSELTIFMRELN